MSRRTYAVHIVERPWEFYRLTAKDWRAKPSEHAELQEVILKNVSRDRAEGFAQAWNIASIEARRDWWAVVRRAKARAKA